MLKYIILFCLYGLTVQISIERGDISNNTSSEQIETQSLENLEGDKITTFDVDIPSSTLQQIDQKRLQNLEKKITGFNSFLKRISNYKANPIVLLDIYAHSTQITCLAVLSNNQLASGSTDQTIKIWNLIDGSLVRTLSGHTGSVKSILFLSNGDLASASEDNTIRIWNLNDGSLRKSMIEHKSSILKLAILGESFMSGSDDLKIKIWPIENRNQHYYNSYQVSSIGTLEGHQSFIESLAELPNGNFASGSNDMTIKIWDTNTKRVINTLKGHKGTINDLIVLPNGNILSSSQDMTVREWNLRNQTSIRTLFSGEMVASMVLLKNGHLAMGQYGKVAVINLKDGIVTRTLNNFNSWVRYMALIPNGNLVTATDDGKIKVWNLDEERITLSEVKEMINNELADSELALN